MCARTRGPSFDREGLQAAVVEKTRQLNDLINDNDEEAHSNMEENTRHFQRAAGVFADSAEAAAGLNPIVSVTEGVTGQSAANTHKLTITQRAIAIGSVASSLLKAPRWLSRLLGTGATGKARKELLDSVRAALQSSDDAVKLEGQAARALKDDLVSFQKQIGPNGSIGELDVETSKFIIEVSQSSKPGKLLQLEKLIQNPDLNPAGKGVVLYAPNITRNSHRAHEATGATVVKTIDELKAMVLPPQP